MSSAILEHVNVTVSDPARSAEVLGKLFGWHIRWEGGAINGGYTIHVGSADSYVALHSPDGRAEATPSSYGSLGGLNHIAVVVDDLDATEEKVKAAGYTPINHGGYEPGRRFYFHDHDNIEYEVVNYN